LKLAKSPDWKDFIQVFNAIHNPKALVSKTGIVSIKIVNSNKNNTVLTPKEYEIYLLEKEIK